MIWSFFKSWRNEKNTIWIYEPAFNIQVRIHAHQRAAEASDNAYAQTRHSIRCLHSRGKDVDEGLDQHLPLAALETIACAFTRGTRAYTIGTEIL